MISRQVAQLAARCDYGKAPEKVRETLKLAVLDCLGCVLGGFDEPSIQRAARVVLALGGVPAASVLPRGPRTNLINAALLNGMSAHVLELDDIHKRAMYHPGVVVIPAALALAESRHVSGKEFLSGVLAGYEVGIRVGEALNPSHFRFWHTTGTVGTLASAAACSRILGLDETGILHALGNAATQAAGLWQFVYDGAMTKPLHSGKACMNGLLSALLAEQGFTGATRPLEGEAGMFAAMSTASPEALRLDDLGSRYAVSEIGFKLHCGCRHTNSPVDNALALRADERVRRGEIRRVIVRVYALAAKLCGHKTVSNASEARFSVTYCVARALVHGSVGPEAFTESAIRDPATQEVARKIEIVVDEDLSRDFPQGYASSVEVELSDGSWLRSYAQHCRGDPENPVGREELTDKFVRLTSSLMPETAARRLADKVMEMETMGDVSELADAVVRFCTGGSQV